MPSGTRGRGRVIPASTRPATAPHSGIGRNISWIWASRMLWGDCDVKEYSFTGAGSGCPPRQHRPERYDRQSYRHKRAVKFGGQEAEATNPTQVAFAGARTLHVESTNGFSSRGHRHRRGRHLYRLSLGRRNQRCQTETAAPNGYEIDNAGPEYVVLPNNGSSTVTITFTDTPTVTATGKIRKVDADDPTRVSAGAVIKITGVGYQFHRHLYHRSGRRAHGCAFGIPCPSAAMWRKK